MLTEMSFIFFPFNQSMMGILTPFWYQYAQFYELKEGLLGIRDTLESLNAFKLPIRIDHGV